MGNTNKPSAQLPTVQFATMSGEAVAVPGTHTSIAEVREAIARTQGQYPVCSIQFIRADGVIIEDTEPMPDAGAQVTVVVKNETDFSGRWIGQGGTEWDIVVDNCGHCLKATLLEDQGPQYNRSGLAVSASWRTSKPLKIVGDTVNGKVRSGDVIQAFFEKSCRVIARSADELVMEEYYHSKEGPSAFETINLLKTHSRTTTFQRATPACS
jgi:hypothetical protein